MTALLLAVVLAAPAAVLPSAHFGRAQKLFAQGHYREALDEFTAASEAAPREVPDLWFDIGQCHRNLGNARQAVAAFRRYLALRPDAADRARVIAMIEKLGGSVDDLPTDANENASANANANGNANANANANGSANGSANAGSAAALAGEGAVPPASTLPGASDTAAAPARVESAPALALIPTSTTADPPKERRRRTWPIWVGVAAGVAAVAAVGIGVGVAYAPSSSHNAILPMPMPMGPTGLGTSVTIDTRGH